MTWFGWVLVVLTVMDVAARTFMIGQPPRVRTPGWQAVDVIFSVAIIVGILVIGTGHL